MKKLPRAAAAIHERSAALAPAVRRLGLMPASAALLLAATACADERPVVDADSARAPVAAAAPGTSAPSDSGALPVDECPLMGQWEQCKLEKRLEQSGLVPVALAAVEHEPVSSVPALVYRLGPAELHAWIFPDSLARRAEQATLDPATAQPRGSLRRWDRPAILIASNNLLAVLLSANARTTERVQLALTAGLPPE